MNAPRFFAIFHRQTPRVPHRVPTIFAEVRPDPVSRFRKAVSHLDLTILWPGACPTTPCHIGHGWGTQGDQFGKNWLLHGGAF
jgi:hypothetical protein